jgi:hypothetical protein
MVHIAASRFKVYIFCMDTLHGNTGETQPERTPVEKIIWDLSDRTGLRQEWEQIDEEIQTEIAEEWTGILAEETDHRTVVTRITQDIASRKGLGNQWEKIDPEIHDEIIQTWTDLIKPQQ